MAGSWYEVTGSRQIDEDIGAIDYTITFEAARTEDSPALGQTYAEVAVAGGTAVPSTGLVAAPEVVQVGRRLKVGGGTKSRIVVRFRGIKADAT